MCILLHDGHSTEIVPFGTFISGLLVSDLIEGLFTTLLEVPFFATRFLTAFFLIGRAAFGFLSSSESSFSFSALEPIEWVPVSSSKIFLSVS